MHWWTNTASCLLKGISFLKYGRVEFWLFVGRCLLKHEGFCFLVAALFISCLCIMSLSLSLCSSLVSVCLFVFYIMPSCTLSLQSCFPQRHPFYIQHTSHTILPVFRPNANLIKEWHEKRFKLVSLS